MAETKHFTGDDAFNEADDPWTITATLADGYGEPLPDIDTADEIEWSIWRPGESTPVHTASKTNEQITVEDEATATITITIPYDDRDVPAYSQYRHELRYVDASGQASIQVRGLMSVVDSRFVT